MDADFLSDVEACRGLLRNGSRSFFLASMLLPRRVRHPASALYAFCRLADDAVDEVADGRRAVPLLRERLARAYDGRPHPSPADRALAVVVSRYRVPRVLPEALLEGFQWDVEGRQYETIADVEAYGARVAGAVGAIVAMLMGVRDAAVAARACDLGVAMQLTNIARDVGEDARAGRLYLPRAWMREAGLDPEAWLAAPCASPALATVVRRLLDHADQLYRRADEGIACLPFDCQPGIRAARLLYAEIGREVLKCDGDSVSRRAVVARARKARLVARAPFPLHSTRSRHDPAPGVLPLPAILPAVRYLVDAVADAPPAPAWTAPMLHSTPWWDFDTRASFVIGLFDRLARVELANRGDIGESRS